MRLLHTATIKVVDFVGEPPPYTILSHMWEEEEVTLQELQKLQEPQGLQRYDNGTKQKKGYVKLQKACELTAQEGFNYVWVDTCCIDKTSSVELSEAINSMYRWYQESGICFAFLSDETGNDQSGIAKSRWFTRGWTLQELIAPRVLLFYNAYWNFIDSTGDCSLHLERALGIPAEVLDNQDLSGVCLRGRMQWISTRVTTRPEDIAYCLLGIFNVNMPLLYGEGKRKAFRRLQEEIVKSSTDLSIFLWKAPKELEDNSKRPYWDLLADDPKWFSVMSLADCSADGALQLQDASMDINNQGRKVNWSLIPFSSEPNQTLFLVMLIGVDQINVGIALQQLDNEGTQFCRVSANRLFYMHSGSPDWAYPDDHSMSLDIGLSTADIIPLRQLSLRRFENTFVQLLPAAQGFLFTPSQLEDASWSHIEVSNAFYSFMQDTGRSLYFVPISSEFTRTIATDALQAHAVGAFHIKARSPEGNLMCDAWVVAGIEILPKTLFGTPNAFSSPWLAIIPRRNDNLDADDAIRKAEMLDQAQRRTTVFSYGEDDDTCCLKIETVPRINGIWYDIKAEMTNGRSTFASNTWNTVR